MNAHSSSNIPANMPGLTGIRGIAALWVLGSHWDAVQSDPRFGQTGAAHAFLAAGWSGVDLFFLLSGFVLMHAHRRQFAEDLLGSIWPFLKARFLRVYPVNTVVLLGIVAIMEFDHSFALLYKTMAPGNLSLTAFVRTATLSTRWFKHDAGDWNQPVWSLSVEIIGYLLFPALIFFVIKLRSSKLSLLLTLFCLSMLTVVQSHYELAGKITINGNMAVFKLCCEFTAGVLLYNARLGDAFIPLRWRSWATLALLISMVCATLNYLWLLPFIFAMLIYGLSSYDNSLGSRLCSSRTCLFLGRISFPLYLVHLTVIQWTFYFIHQTLSPSNLEWATSSVVSISASVGIAYALSRFVEKPFAKLSHVVAMNGGRRLIRRTKVVAFE